MTELTITQADVQKLSLEPGDILVIHVADGIDERRVWNAFQHAMAAAGVNAPILFGPKGQIELQVLRAIPKEQE